jgi:hypothetical protein
VPYNQLIGAFTKDINNNSMKLAILMTDQQRFAFSSRFGVSSLLLKREKSTKMLSVVMKRNCVLFAAVSDAMEKLVPSGIPQQLFGHGMWMVYREHKKDAKIEPTILSFDNLEFGFVVWLGACGISVLEFLVEIFVVEVRKWLAAVSLAAAVVRFMAFYHN